MQSPCAATRIWPRIEWPPNLQFAITTLQFAIRTAAHCKLQIANCKLQNGGAGPKLGLVIAVAFLAGCSQGPEMGQVSGKVTFQGQPVTEGSITFLNLAEGGSAGGDLKPDGTYTVLGGASPGEYTVVVNPPVEIVDTDPGKSPPAPMEKNMPNIPLKYRMLGTSTLKTTIKAGPNTCDFDMQP
jgi:hypothetical protein